MMIAQKKENRSMGGSVPAKSKSRKGKKSQAGVKGKATIKTNATAKVQSKAKVKPKAKVKAKPKAKVKAKNLPHLAEIWPQERDILIRPDRYRYVRKITKPEGCVFCHCAQEPTSLKTLTLVKTPWSLLVLNKFPYNNGHLLVIPRRHCGDLTQLTSEEYRDLMDLLQKAMRLIAHAYGPEGMNVGLNHGAVAGAGIPDHVHWHIVPRWFGDVNFFPLIAESKVVIERLEDSYKRLKKAWGEIL